MLHSQRLDLLWNSFTPSVRRKLVSLPAFRTYQAKGRAAYGGEQRVVREEVRQYKTFSYYLRTATFKRGPRHDWTLILGLDARGKVTAFGLVAARAVQKQTASSGAPGSRSSR